MCKTKNMSVQYSSPVIQSSVCTFPKKTLHVYDDEDTCGGKHGRYYVYRFSNLMNTLICKITCLHLFKPHIWFALYQTQCYLRRYSQPFLMLFCMMRILPTPYCVSDQLVWVSINMSHNTTVASCNTHTHTHTDTHTTQHTHYIKREGMLRVISHIQ